MAPAGCWFYGGLGALGCVTLTLAVLTPPDQEAPNRGLRFDRAGIALGLAATVLPFWAVGELTGRGFDSFLFTVPLALGITYCVALLLVEYNEEEPLSPVRQMWHTFPLVGTLVAMLGGAAFVTFLMLGQQFLLHVEHRSPLATGLALYLLGGIGLPRPDLVAWLEKNRPAIGSPLLAETLRE